MQHVQRPTWKKLAGRKSQAILEVVSRLEQATENVGGVQGGGHHHHRVHQQNSQQIPREGIRVFRKRFYRMADDKEPEFPFQQRNFYNQIMENKEILKSVTLITTCTDNIKKVINYLYIFKAHSKITYNNYNSEKIKLKVVIIVIT